MIRLIFFLFFIGHVAIGQNYNLLPYPVEIKSTGETYRIKEPQCIVLSPEVNKLNIQTYLDWIKTRLIQKTKIDFSVCIKSNKKQFIQLNYESALISNESYRIAISERSVTIYAKSPNGFYYALETIIQLISSDGKEYYLPGVMVNDFPKYSWRGLLIDPCRHFIPISNLYKQIDALAISKMNVLHLHLTEDQGFRIESKKYPYLHQIGSNGSYYTQEEMKKLISYATNRGVRIVPEFDIPAHTTSWIAAYPHLGSSPLPCNIENGYGVFHPTLDPTNEKVYEFIETLFMEMAALFPDSCMHIGGDEVTGKDWKENSKIQSFMLENRITNHHQLQAYFNKRVEKIVMKCGKTMIGWDEVLECSPSQKTIIQSWRGEENMERAMKEGYNVIRSNGYYLDQTYTAGEYYCRQNQEGSTQMKGSKIGIEATMWSELVDSNTIDSRIWPNTAAIAELAWNPEYSKDTLNFYTRLIPFADQLTGVGINYETYASQLHDTALSVIERARITFVCDYIKPKGGYKRHKEYKNELRYTNAIKLNTLADFSRPTSIAYVKFVLLISNATLTPSNETNEALRKLFTSWGDQYSQAQRLTVKHTEDWLIVSKHLSDAGQLGLLWLDNGNIESIKIIINELEKEIALYKGFELAILPVIKKKILSQK